MTTQALPDRLRAALNTTRLKENEFFTLGSTEYEAEFYLEATTIQELASAISEARKLDIPVFILGAGFIPGDGLHIEGLVIKNNCRKFDMLSMKGSFSSGQTSREVAYVLAESGVSLNQLVRFTVDEGLAGLESFLGISGTLGDGLLANITSDDSDFLAGHIFTITVLTKENEMMEVQAEPFLFPIAENMLIKKQVIPLSAVFKLIPAEKSELWKKATQKAFERNQEELTDPLKGNFNF
jgi:UDP-N-acetylenolpyruvoylglucosamine reductase